MAQRTGAKRFLASVAKATSAGGILALVAAVALAGCGGGSSANSTSAPVSTNTAVSRAVSPQGGARPSNEGPDSAESLSSSDTKPNGGSGRHRGKHGPQVVVPKGEPEPAPTLQQREATVANIALASPALEVRGGSVPPLPAAYTCDGANDWPRLTWQGVPSGTAELALFAMNVQPTNEQIFFDWAVAGLDPRLGGLETGRLPKGSVVGQNSFGQNGYSICPSHGQSETYMFVIYALPKAITPKKGFDPSALREAALAASGNAGVMPTSYTRG